MRIVVLSDIHSNLEALDAVLERARDEGAQATYVLGDIVGYGADPNAVIERLIEQPAAVLIAGNHDLAATGRFDTEWFNPVAAQAITWTESVLDPDARALLTRRLRRSNIQPAIDGHRVGAHDLRPESLRK